MVEWNRLYRVIPLIPAFILLQFSPLWPTPLMHLIHFLPAITLSSLFNLFRVSLLILSTSPHLALLILHFRGQ